MGKQQVKNAAFSAPENRGGIGKWQYVYEHDLSQGNQISKQRHFSGEKYLSWCQFKWISRCCHES